MGAGRPSAGQWTAGSRKSSLDGSAGTDREAVRRPVDGRSRAFLSQLPQTCNPIRHWSDVVPFCFGGTATMQTHTKRMKLLKKGQGNMHAEVTCQTQSCSTATGQCMLPPHPDEPKNTALPTTLNYIWYIFCGCRLSSSRPVRKKRNLFDVLLLDSHTPPPPSISMLG